MRSLALALLAFAQVALGETKPFGIHFVDAETGRGVPLVEAETMANQLFVSDSAGWMAFAEPGQMGKPIFFNLHSHGYEFHTDGFGSTGVKLTPQPGETATVKIKRLNIAERLCRLTGVGIYRDSVLLGEPVPLAEPLLSGGVAGQDSVHVAEFGGRLFWLWGDTMRLSYPLGNFRTTCAWSELPAKGGLAPLKGVNFQYITGADGFTREMCPLERKEGVVWLTGLVTAPDEGGHERLVAAYSRRSGMEKVLQQGVAVYNDALGIFEAASSLPVDAGDNRRLIAGHPVQIEEGGRAYFYFGEPFLNARVPATLKAILDPAAYEAWSCADAGGNPQRRGGALDFAWRKDAPATGPEPESRWLKAGLLKLEECRFTPVDAATRARITLHRGSVYWNAWRMKWISIAVQQGGKSSFLGEVYYAEAETPLGPWRRAVKIATHDRYSFYNPVHHPFFDEEGGRLIYLEGTYTQTFSGRHNPTPLYEYNQVLYRLNLSEPRLKAAQE